MLKRNPDDLQCSKRLLLFFVKQNSHIILLKGNTLAEAVKTYQEEAPRGEFVLIVGGASPTEEAPATLEDAVAIAQELLEEGASVSDAAKRAAAQTGLKKSDIYRLLVDAERN